MSPSTIWYYWFQFLINFRNFAKREKVRFIKMVGKLAKFVILSQDARETIHVMAPTRKSNMALPPGHIDSQESPLASTCDGALCSQYCA